MSIFGQFLLIYGIINIPKNFSKNVIKNKEPKISGHINEIEKEIYLATNEFLKLLFPIDISSNKFSFFQIYATKIVIKKPPNGNNVSFET